MHLSLLIPILLIIGVAAQGCTDEYTDWVNDGDCSEIPGSETDCGGYGKLAQTRECADGCDCTGPLEQNITCGSMLPCRFPRRMCDTGYKPFFDDEKITCVEGEYVVPTRESSKSGKGRHWSWRN